VSHLLNPVASKMDRFPKVSIIVPVLNRQEIIGKCIESLLKLDYPSFEVVVVDNGSTDNTREVVLNYPVKLVVKEGGGPYVARNEGIREANGEIVAFTDSDCIVSQNWLRNLIKNYTDNKIGGVCGEIFSYSPHSIAEKFADLIGVQRVEKLNLTNQRGPLKRDPNRFLSADSVAANASYRKTVLKEVNGFDEEIISGGDVEIGWRVLDAGYDLIFDPEAVVWHKHRDSLWKLFKQFFRWGKDQPQLLQKQSGGLSYIEIKTYILPAYELGFKSPIRMLIGLDFLNLFILSLILAVLSRFFLFLSVILFLCVLAGTLHRTVEIVKSSGELKWLVLFSLLHFIRHYAFTIGRIRGGIKYRVLAI